MEDLETVLTAKMKQFQDFLKERGYTLEPGKQAGYGLKIRIRDEEGTEAKAILYYKPSQKTFTLSVDRFIPEALATVIMDLWQQSRSGDAAATGPAYRKLAGIHIYVDGSFLEGHVGYGMLVLKDGQVICEYYGPVTRSSLVSSRQVGGEITAVVRALSWCRSHEIREVTIHYDLEHLGKWAMGEYKARIPMAVGYKKYIDASGIRIHWMKTAAHTGDPYNDRADALARKGAAAGRTPPAETPGRKPE
jgi:ribonuclease HI